MTFSAHSIGVDRKFASRRSLLLLALVSLISIAILPDDSDAQQRRPQGNPAASRQAAVKVPPIGVIGNFSNPEAASEAMFSPDSKLIALSTPSSGVLLWDTSSGRLLRVLTQRPSFMASAFTEDGRQMVTAHKDGTLRLWDLETGAATTLTIARGKSKTGKVEDPEPIRTVWTDPRGDLLVTSDASAAVTIWSLTSKRALLTVQNKGADTPPIIHDARISVDGTQLIVLASKTYKGTDTVTVYDAKSGTQISNYDLPEKHNFIDNGIVRPDEAIVLASTPECDSGELLLFSLKDKSVIVPVFRPATCSKPKDGEERAELKVFHGPDSSSLLIARDRDPELRIFDVATRRLTNSYRWPGVANPQVIGVSGDMRLAATRDADGVTIRALETGAPVKELRSFATYSDAMLANVDGSQFLTQRSLPEGSKAAVDVSLRKTDEAKPLTFQLPAAGGWRIRDFSSAAMLAIAANDRGEIALIPLDGKPLRKIAVQQLRDVLAARISPDGKTAIVLGNFAKSPAAKSPVPAKPKESGLKEDEELDRKALIFDISGGTVRQTIESREDADLTGLAFSVDGTQFACALRNGGAEVWDTASARKIKSLPPAKEDADARSLAFSPDGRLLVGAGMFDDDVFVWNLDSGKIQRIYKMPPGLAGYRYATSLAMSRDRKLLAAGLGQRAVSSGDIGPERGGVLVWDVDTGKLRASLRSQHGAITALAFSPNEKWIVSGSLDGTIQYWDRNTGRPIMTAVAGSNGRWILLGEGGFYAGSDGIDDVVNVVRGNSASSGAAVAKILSRPDVIEALIKGDTAKVQEATKKLDLAPVAP